MNGHSPWATSILTYTFFIDRFLVNSMSRMHEKQSSFPLGFTMSWLWETKKREKIGKGAIGKELPFHAYYFTFEKSVDRFRMCLIKTKKNSLFTGYRRAQRICLENPEDLRIPTKTTVLHWIERSSSKENKFHIESAMVFASHTRTRRFLRGSIWKQARIKKVNKIDSCFEIQSAWKWNYVCLMCMSVRIF